MALRTARAFLAAAALVAAAASARAQAPLEETLIPHLARHELPALAAAVVVRGKLVAAGAVGTRRAGIAAPVGRHDRFHLGAAAQPLTALLAAQQVQAGRLLWTSSLGEVFQELAAGANPAFRNVTLEQLLAHTSGLPAQNEVFRTLLFRAQLEPGNLDAQRYALLKRWSAVPLAALPGTQRVDSPINYILAAAMIERAAQKSWEELMAERVFDALELASAGLGPQASLGRIDAPLPHRAEPGGMEAVLAGPNSDLPAIAGPAGSVHMSVLDFARWTGWIADRGRHGAKPAGADTIDRLLAVGWAPAQADWARAPLQRQSATNGMNLAQAWLDLDAGYAIVLLANVAGSKAERGLEAVAAELYRKHPPR